MAAGDTDTSEQKGKGRATSDDPPHASLSQTASTSLHASSPRSVPIQVPSDQPHADAEPAARPHRHAPPPCPSQDPLSFPRSPTMSAHDLVTPRNLLPLLQCPRCSPVSLLAAPTTLSCGHTVCSEHVCLAPPFAQPLQVPGPSNPLPRAGPPLLPACPLPTCRPSASSSSSVRPNIPAESSVTYFPPPLLAKQSALTDHTATPAKVADVRLDVTVCKILSLFHRAEHWQDEHPTHVPLPDPSDDESEDENQEPSPHRAEPISHPDGCPSRAPHDLPDEKPPPRPRHTGRRPCKRQRTGPQTAPPALPSAPPSPVARFEKELLTELTCEICFVLLYQPVTTPCQHTFCAKCLQRALDHGVQCPLCRTDLPGFSFFQDHPPNRLVLSIILKAFPDLYADRKASIEAEERDSRLDTPIFVCQLSFPGTPTILHFYEPRYRLMLRRCLETPNPRFGMVMPPRTAGGGTDFGTLLEIRTVQMFPDGRSMVETWGVQRFRVLERGTLDGYMVGRIEIIEDYPLSVDDALHASTATPGSDGLDIPSATTDGIDRGVPATNEELMAVCHAFLNKLRHGTAPWVVQRLNHTYGPEPVDDPSNFSFWMALVLPIDEQEKAKLLPIRSPRLRLRLVVHWIEQLNNTWWFSNGCVIC